jgi:tubulin-specific chaperone D
MSSFWFLLLQIGNRRALHDAVSGTWSDCSLVMKTNVSARSPLLRKFLVKLAQRVGLISLPPRLPSWQYKVINLLWLLIVINRSQYLTTMAHI